MTVRESTVRRGRGEEQHQIAAVSSRRLTTSLGSGSSHLGALVIVPHLRRLRGEVGQSDELPFELREPQVAVCRLAVDDLAGAMEHLHLDSIALDAACGACRADGADGGTAEATAGATAEPRGAASAASTSAAAASRAASGRGARGQRVASWVSAAAPRAAPCGGRMIR